MDLNNQSTPPGTPGSRDPKYYFPDGSAIFEVGGVLFKIYGSLLADNISAVVTFRENASSTLFLFDAFDRSPEKPGSSDENPIRIPGVELWEFRLLLLVLMGNPGDYMFLEVLTGAQNKNNHTGLAFLQYLHLGSLAYRFNLTSLANWAWGQLELVLQSATSFVHSIEWNQSHLFKMLEHYDAMLGSGSGAARELLAFFRFILSMAAGTMEGIPSEHDSPELNHENSVALYQKRNTLEPPMQNIVLGSTFSALLSLGPNSPIWKNGLSRDERLTLYAAHADLQMALVNKSSPAFSWVDWVKVPKRVGGIAESVCYTCVADFDSAWQASFGSKTFVGEESNPHNLHDTSSTYTRQNSTTVLNAPQSNSLPTYWSRPSPTSPVHRMIAAMMSPLATSTPQSVIPHESYDEHGTDPVSPVAQYKNISWDVRLLALLPQCRQLFANVIRAGTRHCAKKCNEEALWKIDMHLDMLFHEQLVMTHNEYSN